jgi:xylulokinase
VTYTLGIDIGTFESKGVLVEVASGRIVAEARHPHRMLVPQPGWAEHRAEEDWWGDFVRITRAILASSGVKPGTYPAWRRAPSGPACCRWTRRAAR